MEASETRIQPVRKRSRRKHISPEAGSLLDLMHDHAGTSLFVLPICWTDTHANLLRCQWVRLPPQATPVPSTSLSPRKSGRTPPTVISMRKDLNTLMATDGSRPLFTKNRAIRDLLSTLFPNHLSKPKSCADLDVKFGSRWYQRAVRCQSIWKHPDSNSSFDSATTCSNRSASQLMASMSVAVNTSNDPPILAYVSRSHLNHIRKNCFRILPGPNRTYNGPVHRLQALRSKSLLPKNLDEDQYFIPVMIALAQQAVYSDTTSLATFTRRDVKIRLISISEEEDSFLVYTGTVPAGLLGMFHEPEKAPVGDTDIRIEYTSVPVWPVLGLKERLGQALGRDVVGDIDAFNMDTYEDELSPAPETPSPKRRRDVLSEVFNSSFSEDREPESPGDLLGKRRCLEGRVGVVR